MFRLNASAIALVVSLIGCASTPRNDTSATPRQHSDPQLTTEEQKILACLDLQDHIVDLYATEYVRREGVQMGFGESTAFRGVCAEQLAKRGTFDRFGQAGFV